jgi:signal transduction histidine kinase
LEEYFDRLEPAERREQLISIQKNTRRMSTLMEEVLLLGMAEAGKLDFRPALLDLPIFCRRLTEDLLSATDHKCPIEFVYAPERHACLGDERLLRHIFVNLLSNAVKYSPPAAVVRFEIEQEGLLAVCRVRDRGVGIRHDDLARLFHAFHRGSNVGQVPGSGLGLTIVKRCLELHGGTIEVQSALNQGTTVTLHLPLFDGTPASPRETTAGPKPTPQS